jgi:molybdopterin converting factor small subunit
MMAVNSEYATLDQIVRATDEVAIIPPVAGG